MNYAEDNWLFFYDENFDDFWLNPENEPHFWNKRFMCVQLFIFRLLIAVGKLKENDVYSSERIPQWCAINSVLLVLPIVKF